GAALRGPLVCAGGIATPADGALVMQLGAQSVFVGSGIFKSSDPPKRARAIVEATTHYTDADIVAKVSRGLGEAMPGEEIGQLEVKLAHRGWEWSGGAGAKTPSRRPHAGATGRDDQGRRPGAAGRVPRTGRDA